MSDSLCSPPTARGWLFTSRKIGTDEMYTLDADGSDLRQLKGEEVPERTYKKPVLVYGEIDGLVFMSRGGAVDLKQTNEALRTAKTWGECGKREKFGPIDRSDHQVEDWERLADAVNYVLNAKGHKTTDEMRRAIGGLDGYTEMSYYERWAAAAELLVVEKGFLTKEEIDARAAELEQRWGKA